MDEFTRHRRRKLWKRRREFNKILERSSLGKDVIRERVGWKREQDAKDSQR